MTILRSIDTAQNIIDITERRQAEIYKEVCEEMKAVLQLEKEVADKKGKLKKIIIKCAGGDRLEHGIKVSERIRQGVIDYKALAKEFFPIEEEFKKVSEEYRKDCTCFWEVRSY